jgi:3,4-dihydroxy 2-butanone 4-phosphate synthase/GTP cyclohydrolase II
MAVPTCALRHHREAIEEIREGRFVVVVDDPDRENEGDLVIARSSRRPRRSTS